MIRRQIPRQHPERDVLNTPALDPPRRALPNRVGVEQHRDQHRRVISRPAMTVIAIPRIERRQIHRRHRVKHPPRQVILRQPIPQRRRQQKHLIPISTYKVLSHDRSQLTPPDGTPIYETASRRPSSRITRSCFARLRTAWRSLDRPGPSRSASSVLVIAALSDSPELGGLGPARGEERVVEL
jgi:hypothetical protein